MAITANLKLGISSFLFTAMLPLGAAGSKVLNIGHITALTGSEAYIGEGCVPSLEDYVNDLNAKGGVNGYKFKVISYDGRSEAADCVAIARRLIDQDKCVAIIGPTFSGAAIPVAKIADDAHVPCIATTATNINVTVDESGKVHPYMFRVSFIDPYQGKALADYAFNRLHKRRVAFLTDVASPYTVGVHQYFSERFKQLGGQVVLDEGYNKGDQEFRAQLAKVRSSKADVLVAAADNFKDPGLIAKQAKALGLNVSMMGADGWMVEDLLKLAGPELEGAFFTTIASVDDPQYAPYNNAFAKRHNGKKPNIWSYLNLDAMMIIENAVRQVTAKGGAPESIKLRDAIENTKELKVFTCKFTYDKTNHNPLNKPVVLMKITGSKFQVVESYAPKN
jgi:branched-chain amino acid transport system substrate-binding protein